MSGVMKPVVHVLTKFGEWLKPVLDAVKFVGEVFHDIRVVLDKVVDAIKPIKWALDAAECIFEKVVKPVLDWIMEVSKFNYHYNFCLAICDSLSVNHPSALNE